MEQWSPSSGSYGADLPNRVEVTAVKNSNGNHMFVGRSQTRPLELPPIPVNDVTKKKKKKKKGTASLFLSAKLWTDPEMKRKRRVAKYKMYSAEGKLKASFKKGFRWVKRNCSRFVHGF